MTKIVFYYPSRSVGGAQLLFVRLANLLALNPLVDVYVVDYVDGFLKSKLKGGVSYLPIDEFKPLNGMNDACVIAPLSMILSLKGFLENSDSFNYLFWCIHPENTVDVLRGAQRLKFLGRYSDTIVKIFNIKQFFCLRRDIKAHFRKEEVYFMDLPNLQRTEGFYRIKLGVDKFLPIPVYIPEENFFLKPSIKDKFNVLWLGRLSRDKIYSLLYVARKLEENRSYDICLHVIGDGDYKRYLTSFKVERLQLVLHGETNVDNIYDFIIENKIALAFGMGTSILDIAKYSVPSLIIDPSYTDISSGYKPRWLHQTKNFNLGSFEHNEDGQEFNSMLEAVVNDRLNSIGRKCREYVSGNHCIKKVSGTILSLAIKKKND